MQLRGVFPEGLRDGAGTVRVHPHTHKELPPVSEIKGYKQELVLERRNRDSIIKQMRGHEKGSAMWNYLDGQLDRSKARLRFIEGRLAALEGNN